MKLSLEEQVQLRINTLEKWISEKERSLKRAPEGKMRAYKKGKQYHYYLRKDSSDKEGEYIQKSKVNLIRKLAQKEYDERIIRKAKGEITQLQKIMKYFEKEGLAERAYSEIPESKRRFVDPVEGIHEERIRKWLNQTPEEFDTYEKTYDYVSERGERVRSKSELIIANKLAKAGIPYQYEKSLMLKGFGTVHPDFTIYDANEDREIYLEHLGKVSDPEYMEKNLLKINAYQLNGFLFGERFFITMESMTSPLNTKILDGLIEQIKEIVS